MALKKILCIACAIFVCHASSAAERPNIVIILADDLGFSDLGCYGSEIDTPHLDALARNGLRFTEVHNSGRCWPSRAALMTGYYPQQTNRAQLPDTPRDNNAPRPPWARALPEFLAPAGYRNYHSGKWHIDGKVLDAGFHRSLKLDGQQFYFSGENNEIDDQPAPDTRPGYYSTTTTATADHAIACLVDHAAHYADRPFFQFIPFTAPHFPLQALPEDIAKDRDRYHHGWDKLRESLMNGKASRFPKRPASASHPPSPMPHFSQTTDSGGSTKVTAPCASAIGNSSPPPMNLGNSMI